MPKVFLFDIGNVLWQYRSSLDRLYHSWALICNLTTDEFREKYKSYYKYLETNEKSFSDFINFLGFSDTTPFISALELIYTPDNFTHNLNQPLLNLITDLRSITKVGYLSNAENFFYPYIQQQFDPYFDFGYSSWQLGLDKPDPAVYLKTLELQQLKPDDVVFIDDTAKNIDSAQSLGIKSILFQNNQQLLSELRLLDF